MSQSPSILPHLQSHSHPAKKPYHAVSHGDAIGNNDDKGATDAGENEASLVSEATSSLPTTEDSPALHCTALTQNPFDQSNEPDNHQETRPATVDPRPTPCRPRSDPHRHLHPRAAQDSTQPHSILTSSAAQPPPKAKPATYDDHGWPLTLSQPPNRGEGGAGDEWNRRLGFCAVGQASLLERRSDGLESELASEEARTARGIAEATGTGTEGKGNKDRATYIVSPNRCIPSLSDPSSIL